MLIVDNVLSPLDFENLQNLVLSTEFPWYWQSYVSLPPWCVINDPRALETFGWNHQVYNKETEFKGDFLEAFAPVLQQIKNYADTKIEFIRIRLSMKVFKKGFTKNNYNLPHIDYNFPHKTVIFYLNDSDGPTWIFNEIFNGKEEPLEFTVKETIDPKENRMILIEGLQYHTASNPIDSDRRVILNINYIEHDR